MLSQSQITDALQTAPYTIEADELSYLSVTPDRYLYCETTPFNNTSEAQTIFDAYTVWSLNLSGDGCSLQILRGTLQSSENKYNDRTVVVWEEISVESLPAFLGVKEEIINSPACSNLNGVFERLWLDANKRYSANVLRMSECDAEKEVDNWVDQQLDGIERAFPSEFYDWVQRCS
ncbi:hypothetical protein AB4254_08525 [Vibrio breoganii]